ncbi:hypothetical protein EDEG_03466 [Edhazardia aedis USNM 41457]|uniref:Uncharacterized protein n=1 Tax=Edhazardia aedis (strain USNM 41457) TaxID=1003232 RepID=J9D2Q7_EDHAE|nr:hypothetical protein EDEG_03466 [Edhazardia aedis USNM 41457]|eukprot:EJW02081.1 hypothetical protein EDEG_03466 [Edhazardia aedis USNM 41457]
MVFLFQAEIKSMMYATGDLKHPNDLASQYIELIIKNQIQNLLKAANNIKTLRKAKTISVEDICFVLRTNKFKVRRVLDSITFKDLRKKVNSEDYVVEVKSTDFQFSWMFDRKKYPLSVNPFFINRESAYNQELQDIRSFMNDLDDTNKNESLNSHFEEESDIIKFERLKRINLITEMMTKEEYLEFSECRQASFIFRKIKKFKQFLTFNEKMKDYVYDVLGFICYEMVVDIVEEGLKILKKTNQADFYSNGLFNVQQRKGLGLFEIKEACRRLISKNGALYL